MNFKDYLVSAEGICDKTKMLLEIAHRRNFYEDMDTFWLVAGVPGVGKSTLCKWLYKHYCMGSPLVSHVALDKDLMPKVLRLSVNEPELKDRVFWYDEANVSSRDAMGGFNKRVIDLYEAIRVKHALHLWANPSVQYLDKKFIEERINGLFFVYKRGCYFFITRRGLIEMFEKYGNLKQETIMRNGFKFAVIKKGLFEVYPNDDFEKAYISLKNERIIQKLARFEEDNSDGEEWFSYRQSAKVLEMGLSTFNKFVGRMKSEGLFDESKFKTITGRVRLPREEVDRIGKYISDSYGTSVKS